MAASLVALATSPVLLDRKIRGFEGEIADVLDPARELSAELSVLLAREMSRFESYLLTGDPAYASLYNDLRAREEEVHRALVRQLALTDIEIREKLADLRTLTASWQVNHAFALAGEAERVEYLGQVPAELRRYEEVLAATEDLAASLGAATVQARARMERAREIQLSITVALAGMALLATVAVAGIGQGLRSLVTEGERRREEALRARREMEAVLEATADGVLGLDLAGRCTSLNQTATRLLGHGEVEAQGRSVHHLLHGRAPDEGGHDAESCPVLVALRSGGIEQQVNDDVWRRDGTSFPARWHLRPLRDGPEVRGGVLTLTDMTEIRRAESALRQAVQARDQVVAVVSHDLRNPLGTISAAADLILDLDLPAEKQEEQLHIIRRTTDRMNRLIQDLLDVSRIEGGGLRVDLRPAEVKRLMTEAVEPQRLLARDRGLELVARVPDELPRVRADHDRIMQVFSNLIANAMRHTPAGGTITLEARAEPARVVFSVTDTGEGILPEELAHLFDRLWHLSRTGRSGAGLGLAIVKGIVEAHGGEVWADSEPGRGSSFSFTLPFAGEVTEDAGLEAASLSWVPGRDPSGTPGSR